MTTEHNQLKDEGAQTEALCFLIVKLPGGGSLELPLFLYFWKYYGPGTQVASSESCPATKTLKIMQ